MTPVRLRPRPRLTGRLAFGLLPAVAGLALTLVAGCGKQSTGQEVLATVGDAKITRAYYEERLGKLKPDELPRGEDGSLLDTGGLEGKRAFLNVIIDKELMAQKAKELGFGEDERIAGTATAITEYKAAEVMHKDLVEDQASKVSNEELAEYQRNRQTRRRMSFIITNFRDDAEKARQAVIDGGLWEDVADEHNEGSRGPNDNYTMSLDWGVADDNFEKAVFSLKEGEISAPVQTIYGYWVFRLDAVEPVRVAPFDSLSARDQERVLNSVRARKINLKRREFIEESRRKHDFKLDEAGLWIVYQGLPEGEQLMDPATGKPVARENLAPLEVPREDLDKFLYSVQLGDKLETWTIGDYKSLFDRSNVFERPKKDKLLGGLREHILGVVDRQLLVQEARERGYMDDARVTGDVDQKREQMMVTKLHQEVVTHDERITPEQMDAFWQEYREEYRLPEKRSGRVLYCADEAGAGQAVAAAAGGRGWEEIVSRYAVPGVGRGSDGSFGPLTRQDQDPLRDPLFSLAQPGDVTQPFKSDKYYAVVRLDKLEPERQAELDEVRTEVGQRMLARRKDEALRKLLGEWREQFPVKVFEKQLAKARSYEELTAAGGDQPAAGAPSRAVGS